MRRLCLVLWILGCGLFMAGSARAQLAQSFYNITDVRTDVLPNAIRVTVETDGKVELDGDYTEYYSTDPTGATLNPASLPRVRLRFLGAKAKIPAFVEIGKYPVDAINVALAQDRFKYRINTTTADFDPGNPAAPAVDLEFRFYVSVRVRGLWMSGYSPVLAPLDISIATSPDQRSAIITVMTDRIESNRLASGLQRSPAAEQKHHSRIAAIPGKAGRVSIDVLHTPLTEILSAVSNATGVPLQAQPDAAEKDITLFLPETDIDGLIVALGTGYGFSATTRPEKEGGGYLVGVTGPTLLSERVPVRYSPPEKLRLLFPDFLLPYLRADTENNALIVTGNRALIDRIRADVQRLDIAPATIRVEANVYEITETAESIGEFSAMFSQEKAAFSTEKGTVAVKLTPSQSHQYSALLTALEAEGIARLREHPMVVVQSGSKGTLFFGQTRFLQVTINSFFGPSGQIIQIPVGTTITVTPTAVPDSDADITLDLAPQFSTVNAMEAGTGLPTLGIREVASTVRIKPGDTILVAGLVTENRSRTRKGIFGMGGYRHNQERVLLAVFVTARREKRG